ncbi:HlyD family secretion protein [Roseibium denhamense]|uniref:Multidrug resistance efflux pump n=1 Tax=Roseibium denhamense TaxID=76305 RepID=A0ABY1PN76_9HYPH|nr:HlyD family secretion protein [Roseibium denhamense]MTI05788.1 HlyD family secretion protein [Roseibium denhamense]SMP37021.1 Multidrug resistance efflux pump [Roseibium denhamense]
MELLLCSMVTLLPDYLFRRYVQGKRFGYEITIYSVWFELRYGIVTCALLTISLITLIFYYHPSTNHATLIFRTIPILPETRGRVVEIYVDNTLNTQVKAGDKILRMDSSQDELAANSDRQQINEIEAEIRLAEGELQVAEGQVSQAEASLKQAQDELDTKQELYDRNPDVVPLRELEKLRTSVQNREGALEAAIAQKELIETKINTALPARKQTAEARLQETLNRIEKMTIYAGVDGAVEQFSIRAGDVLNPAMRPGGVLIPSDAGHDRMIAGFNQIEAQVIKKGMIGEVTCAALPFTIIPVVVSEVQDYLASGQFSASGALVDVSANATPGTITTSLEPLYAGGFDKLVPGSRCVANLYTSNHDRLTSGEPMGTGEFVFLHVVDTVGLVHAILLRSQALQLPIRTLVLSGGH